MKLEDEYVNEVSYLIIDAEYEKALLLADEGLSLYPNSAQLENEKGVIYFFKEQDYKSIQHYRNTISKDSSWAAPEHSLGSVYYKLELYEKAIYHYKQSILKDMSYPDPEYGLGNVYYKLGSYEESIQYYKNAISKDASFALPEYCIGNVYDKLGLYEKAIHHYEKAISKDSSFAAPDNNLGYIYFKQGLYEKAIHHYMSAISKDASLALPEDGLGRVYCELGLYKESIFHYENAISKDALSAAPENSLGNVYHKLELYEKAIHHYQNAISKDAFSAAPENGLGNVYNKLGWYEKSIYHYEQSISKDAFYADPENGLGNVYCEKGLYEKAIQHYKNAISKNTSLAHPDNGLGNAYFRQGLYEKAIQYYENAIMKDASYAAPDNGLGNVYCEKGLYEKAIQYYKNAIMKDASFAAPDNGLGNVYYELGLYKESIHHYESAIYKDVSYATPENGLGNVYYKQGLYEKSVYHYEQSVAKDAYYFAPELGLGNVYTIFSNLPFAKNHYLRFLVLEGPLHEPSSIFSLVSFFLEKSPSPFVVGRLLKKYFYKQYDILDLWENIRQATEDIELYLTYLKQRPDVNEMQYKYLLAIAYFFMDLPFETYRVCEDDIDSGDHKISLMGNYYWLAAASSFSVPQASYDTILSNAIDDADELYLSRQSENILDYYYAGQIFWIKFFLEKDLSFARKADDCFTIAEEALYLPASYMRVLTLKALSSEAYVLQVNFVKKWEDRIQNGPMYLGESYKIQELKPEQKDFFAPFLFYAQLYEIQEAIEIVSSSEFVLPQFYETLQLSAENKQKIQKLVESKQQEDLRNSIERSLTEALGEVIDEEKANKLLKRLKGIRASLNVELQYLFDRAGQMTTNPAEDPDSLESELATFIHDCKFPNKGRHLDEVYWGRDKNIQLIAYFFYKGYLLPVQVLSLVYYAIFIDELRKPKPLSFFIFKESGIEGISDSGKDVLEKGADLLIDIGLSLAIPKAIVLKFLVGFTVKYIIGNVATLLNTKEIKDSAHQHYSDFKKRLETNTFNLIKEYHPKSALEQEALDIIQGWYSYK